MAGLTSSGFEVDTLSEIQGRIRGKLELINPGFDFSADSPDGQLIDIMTYEIFLLWTQLGSVYQSYDPQVAQGAALRNIGTITGIPFGNAQRSYATVELTGTQGSVVPANSLFADADGNQFYVTHSTTIPNNTQVVCTIPGPIPVTAGTITTIVTPVNGLTSIAQATDGVIGTVAQTDQEYRNLRQATVMRNATSVGDLMQARLLETGVQQATVFNNTDVITVDGVPAGTIRVTVGEVGDVTDQTIASVIFESNSAGCPTHGTTTEAVIDSQGYSHDVNFVKATEVPIHMTVQVTFLDDETAGLIETMKANLAAEINALLSGQDVIYTRMFGPITRAGNVQIDFLELGRSGAEVGANTVISDIEFASCDVANLDITETP